VAAVTLLLERLDGSGPRQVVVRDPSPTLIRRGSTAPPPS